MTLASAVRGSWHQFLAAFEGLRPELYRYCRHLTRSPWDAEDLAQDVLARAFVTLGKLGTRRRTHARGCSASRATRGSITRLAPQERAAVVLKDVFDLPIEDIAEALSTTPNAVKAALHRGRGKLADEPLVEERVPTPAALDSFPSTKSPRETTLPTLLRVHVPVFLSFAYAPGLLAIERLRLRVHHVRPPVRPVEHALHLAHLDL